MHWKLNESLFESRLARRPDQTRLCREDGQGYGVILLLFRDQRPPGEVDPQDSQGSGALPGFLPPNTTNIRKFSSPEIIFGEGAFALLGRYAAQFRARLALLITDGGVRRTGWAARAEDLLRREGVSWVAYEREVFQPKDQEIMVGVDQYLRRRCNLVVAVGGGSVIDCAKGICAVVGNGRHILGLAGGEETILPGPPLVAVPTTPGSGAEASQFVVFTDTRRRRKLVAVGRALVPSLTLVDPNTAATLSSSSFGGSVLDAFSHAVEAYVSTARSPLTDLHALAAVHTLGRLLAGPEINPNNAEQLAAASLGGLHAGLAFSNAGLGLAHALAHALESLTDLDHADCMAWALPAALRYNYSAVPERYEQIGRALGAQPEAAGSAAEDSSWLIEAVLAVMNKTLLQREPVPPALPENGPALISELALNDIFIATNPKIPSQDELEHWLAQTMK